MLSIRRTKIAWIDEITSMKIEWGNSSIKLKFIFTNGKINGSNE